MKEFDQTDNLVDQVYEQMLRMLYNRGLTGSEPLSTGGLAEAFGVSRTPVNMALVRLESQGLIQRIPNKGWVTVPLTIRDLEEIFDLKDVLEPLTARMAAENVTPEAAAELRGIMDEMEAASQTGDVAMWLDADHRYHDLLSELARNERLRQFQDQLNNQLYRLWVGYSAMEGCMAGSCVEHRAVCDAVATGDPVRAAAEAMEHTRSLRQSLLAVVRNVLIPFLGEEL